MKKMLMKITLCLCLVFVFVTGCKSSQKIDDSDQWTKPIPLPEAPVSENWHNYMFDGIDVNEQH